MTKKLLLLSSIALFAACSSKLAAPTEADLAGIQDKYPDATLMALNEGKTGYQEVCSNCHALYLPGSYTDAQWAKLVKGMSNKARNNGIDVSEEREANIAMYLMAVNEQ